MRKYIILFTFGMLCCWMETPKGWPTNLGCFQDDWSRVLPHFIGRLGGDLPLCMGKCRERGLRFTGFRLGVDCYCGDKWPRLGLTPRPCNKTCIGGESCGGSEGDQINVYTVCPNNTHWDPLQTRCVACSSHCLLDPVCHQGKGDCQDWKCKPGWRGALCKTACGRNDFGSGCSNTCGECYYGPCNHSTGDCPNNRCKYRHKSPLCLECRNGYTGDLCKDVCPDGKYGRNCSSNCGQCETQPCRKPEGECIGYKCLPGYKELICNVECSAGFYGQDCLNVCNCGEAEKCNPINGTCTPIEKQRVSIPNKDIINNQNIKFLVCNPGFYGNNCLNVCSCVGEEVCDTINGTCAFPDNKNAGNDTEINAKIIQKDSNGGMLSGLIVILLMSVIIITVLVIVIIRLKRTIVSKEEEKSFERDEAKKDVFVYENVETVNKTENVEATTYDIPETTVPSVANDYEVLKVYEPVGQKQ